MTHGEGLAAPSLAAAAALGVAPQRCVHVGDRYEMDARPAAEAGLLGVWLDRPGCPEAYRCPVGPRDSRVREVTSLISLAEVVGDPRPSPGGAVGLGGPIALG